MQIDKNKISNKKNPQINSLLSWLKDHSNFINVRFTVHIHTHAEPRDGARVQPGLGFLQTHRYSGQIRTRQLWGMYTDLATYWFLFVLTA